MSPGERYITDQLGKAQIEIAQLLDGLAQKDEQIQELAVQRNTLMAALTDAQKKRLGLEVEAV